MPSQPHPLMISCNFTSENEVKKNSASKPQLCFSHCILFFSYTKFMEMDSTCCSHPPSRLTVLHSHPQVVTCNYSHVVHNPLCLIFGGLKKTLIFPDCQLKVTHSALHPFSPLSSVVPCCLLILLHQLTFKFKRAFECSFGLALSVPGENAWPTSCP